MHNTINALVYLFRHPRWWNLAVLGDEALHDLFDWCGPVADARWRFRFCQWSQLAQYEKEE